MVSGGKHKLRSLQFFYILKFQQVKIFKILTCMTSEVTLTYITLIIRFCKTTTTTTFKITSLERFEGYVLADCPDKVAILKIRVHHRKV